MLFWIASEPVSAARFAGMPVTVAQLDDVVEGPAVSTKLY